MKQDFEKLAKDKWNENADQYNQWSELGQDEKDQLIAEEKENYIKFMLA